jgi:drug/metabolite transporter (DMT)-like permease
MSMRAWSAFAALGILWGLPYFFIKLAQADLAPVVIAWSRIAIGAAVLLPIAWRRGALRGLLAHKAPLFAFAMLEMAMPFTAISIGERWISSSAAGMLIATVPLWLALLSRFFGVHEPLGWRRLCGLLLGFVGVAALLGFGSTPGPLGWAGVGCVLFAALGYAMGPLIVQRHLGGVDPCGAAAASLLVGAAVLSPAAAASLPDRLPSPLVLVSLATLGVACTGLSLVLMFYLIGQAGASRTSVITYINPAVAALLGVVVLHEHFGIGGFAAFALILLGSWMATRGGGAPRRGRRPAVA